MHKAFAVGCLALMAGCTTIDSATLSWDNLTAETNRDLRQALYEIPFSEGPISIIVTESGTSSKSRIKSSFTSKLALSE